MHGASFYKLKTALGRQKIILPTQRHLSVENSFSKGSKSTEPQVDIKTLGNNKIDYLVDHETNEVVIRIVDNESGEVIRQIPGEEFLRFANRISNFNQKYLDETI